MALISSVLHHPDQLKLVHLNGAPAFLIVLGMESEDLG